MKSPGELEVGDIIAHHGLHAICGSWKTIVTGIEHDDDGKPIAYYETGWPLLSKQTIEGPNVRFDVVGRNDDDAAMALRMFAPEATAADSGGVVPDYWWRSPDGNGWVDAWNGWYATEAEAIADGAAGAGRPWVLRRGEGVITADEQAAR